MPKNGINSAGSETSTNKSGLTLERARKIPRWNPHEQSDDGSKLKNIALLLRRV